MDISANTLFTSVNTSDDRKKLIKQISSVIIKNGQPCIFISSSFWQSLYFYNSFKKKYKNFLKLHPKSAAQLHSINFSDYYSFLKFVISSKSIPENLYCLVFDIDAIITYKYFFLYRVLIEEGLKFSATISSVSNIEYQNYFKFEKIIKCRSKFNVVFDFKTRHLRYLPKNSVLFCLDRNYLNKLIQRQLEASSKG